MNMRKIPNQNKHPTALMQPLTERVLRLCLTLVLLVTLVTIFELMQAEPLTHAEAAYFARIAEYLITTTALVTAGTYLLERVLREQNKKEP